MPPNFMTTAASICTSARYDLIDEKNTQYSDAMLLDFLNRGLRPLCTALASVRSDWVNTQTSLTLSSGDSSVALPTLFISPIRLTYGTQDITKTTVSDIRDKKLSSTSGLPNYYAVQGLNILFDRTADADYALTFEYNTSVTELTATTDNMPFNDEFNDVIRQFIILLGKNRNKQSVLADAGIQDFFYSAVFSKLVSRNYVPNYSRTDF